MGFNTTMVDEGLFYLERVFFRVFRFNTTMVDEGRLAVRQAMAQMRQVSIPPWSTRDSSTLTRGSRPQQSFNPTMGDGGLVTLISLCLSIRGFNPTMFDGGRHKDVKVTMIYLGFNPTMVDEKGENNDERSL